MAVPKPSTTQPSFSGDTASHNQSNDPSMDGGFDAPIVTAALPMSKGGNQITTQGVTTPDDGGGKGGL